MINALGEAGIEIGLGLGCVLDYNSGVEVKVWLQWDGPLEAVSRV